MEYEKIENLLGDASNKTSKLETGKWIEINDNSIGTYSVGSQIRFKTIMLKSSYVITVTHISMLSELLLLIILLLQMLMQIILIKRKCLKIALHLLIV